VYILICRASDDQPRRLDLLKRPVFGYLGMAYAMVSIGFIGFLVWAITCTVGLSVDTKAYFVVATWSSVPTASRVFSWIARCGAVRSSSRRRCSGRSASSSCSLSVA